MRFAAPGQVLDPATRVDNIHSRSDFRSSGGNVGYRPRKRSIGSTGTSAMREPIANASTFWPGRMLSFSRTSLGMTTWYLDDTVTTVTCHRHDQWASRNTVAMEKSRSQAPYGVEGSGGVWSVFFGPQHGGPMNPTTAS